MKTQTAITIEVTIQASVERVWKYWTTPADIVRWNNATDDWHTPRAVNDLRIGGRFNSRMEAKDGSSGFDFAGIYDNVVLHKKIDYTLDDGRKVHIAFAAGKKQTTLTETFEAESEYPPEMQREGWLSILNNFKRYVETKP